MTKKKKNKQEPVAVSQESTTTNILTEEKALRLKSRKTKLYNFRHFRCIQ